MRPVQQSHLSPVVRLFVGHKAHVQAAFCSRELLRHAFRCFDDPEVECFALHDELVFVLQFLLNLFDVLAGEARHDTVHQRGIHAACPFEPCREIPAELPEVDVLSDDSLQVMPVLENQFAGKNNQSLAFVAIEMPETMVEQLRQFPGVGDCRTVVEPASRIECDAGLGRIGNHKTNFRLFGQFHILVKMTVRVKRTTDDIYQAVCVYHLPVFKPLQVDMVKAVLPVEHIHHAFFDRLYHDHTAVEVTALIHIRYNPIHEGAQEIAFAKLYDSLRSHCLRSRLTIQFTHGYIDLIDLYLF